VIVLDSDFPELHQLVPCPMEGLPLSFDRIGGMPCVKMRSPGIYEDTGSARLPKGGV
jgi:hypothetical protein